MPTRCSRSAPQDRSPAPGLVGLLLSAQTGISLALVLAAGLLLRGFVSTAAVDPGFVVDNVLRFGIGIPEARYDTEEKIIAFHEALAGALDELPGVRDVGFVAALPLGGRRMQTWFAPDGEAERETDRARVRINVISPGYLEALRIPVVRGRAPGWADGVDTPRLAWLNEALVAAGFGAVDPLGEQLQVGWRSRINPPGTSWEVAGVV